MVKCHLFILHWLFCVNEWKLCIPRNTKGITIKTFFLALLKKKLNNQLFKLRMWDINTQLKKKIWIVRCKLETPRGETFEVWEKERKNSCPSKILFYSMAESSFHRKGHHNPIYLDFIEKLSLSVISHVHLSVYVAFYVV